MPKIGDVVAGKYRLDALAGEGGMGVVYAAEHLVLKQRVAVKVLLPDAVASEATVERFAREARAAAKIDSEHVARVLDAGTTAAGSPFLVMEYLEGCDLEELLDLQRTVPVREAVDYLVQALVGLAHTHAASVVHRDLKPANLFLASRPDGTTAIKLVDFGISKSTRGQPEDKRLTGHHVLGSPVYMSPEQLRNATDIDPRADIWSVGVVAYEMLTGELPFDGDGVGEIFAAILEKEPLPLVERDPNLPKELSDIVARCLRRLPAERWSDAAELARALSAFGNDPQTAMVERAEQVLRRAKLLAVDDTPIEARRVVDAIEAAARSALKTASQSGRDGPGRAESRRRDDTGHALPLLRTKGPRALSPPPLLERVARFVRGAPLLTVVGLATVLALSSYGVVVATRSSMAATGGSTVDVPVVPAPPAVASAGPGAATEGTESAEAETASPASVRGERPPTRAHGPKASGSHPQRPKFLNSRE